MSWMTRAAVVYDEVMQKGDPRVADWFMMSSPLPSFLICLGYMLITKVGPLFMANRKPLEIRSVMLTYNISMVLLSAYILEEFMVSGWFAGYSIRCQPVDYSSSPQAMRMARACWWFYFSKFIELLDTVFFIVRKKFDQISFLHVFHHGIMPVSWWFGVKFVPGGFGTFHAMLNSFIHLMMYTYYGLSAAGPQFKKYLWWKRYMTSMQINVFAPDPTGTAGFEENSPIFGTPGSFYSSGKMKKNKIYPNDLPNDLPWNDYMNERDHEIERANVIVHGDPLKSDELTVAIETNKNKFNVSVRRCPTSILMEDVNVMELSFKSGQLKIKKERLPIDIHENSKHFFQDAEAGVAISVQKSNSQQMHVEGMVSDELFLLPPGDSVRHKRSVEVESHTLWKRHIPVSVLDEVMGIPLPDIVRNATNSRIKRQSQGGGTPYIDVEVCVLIDYALYLKAGKNLRDLAAYMLHFWHAVNLRFATIKDMRINIKLKTVGVFQDEESQVFLKNNMLQGKKRVFEARHALSDLQRWLSYHYNDFSKFDVIFLLTGDDGCVFSGQACEKRVTGVSYVGGACRRHWLMGALNVAIGETDLVFRGVFTAAHEVGHLLGAPHDGEIGAEICTTNSGYLMSYNRSDPIKAHRFSICSINKFKEFLKTSSANCLWNRAVEPIPYPDVLPGQQMKLKDQCYNYVKGDPCEVSEFQCHHLCCYDEKRKYIFTREQPAVHGTDCGINSICYHGKCISKEKLSGLH